MITKHKENGTVIIIRNIESAVRRNAVNPRPSESAVKKEKTMVKYLNYLPIQYADPKMADLKKKTDLPCPNKV